MGIFARNPKRKVAVFTKSEEGLAFIEFALSIVVLLTLFFGSVEITRYILIVQKMEKTVDTLTDVLTQAIPGSVSNSAISGYLTATPQLMSPYTFTSNGNVILTDISTPTGGSTTPTIQWQVCGGGSLHVVSAIGVPNATGAQVTLPSGYAMESGEEVVIGEIFYNFTPILLGDLIQPSQVYRTAVFKPRYGYQSLDNPNNVTSTPCS